MKEPKIMTPIEGKRLVAGRREFKHGEQIPPELADKFQAKFMEEWKHPKEEKPEKEIRKQFNSLISNHLIE